MVLRCNGSTENRYNRTTLRGPFPGAKIVQRTSNTK